MLEFALKRRVSRRSHRKLIHWSQTSLLIETKFRSRTETPSGLATKKPVSTRAAAQATPTFDRGRPQNNFAAHTPRGRPRDRLLCPSLRRQPQREWCSTALYAR